MGYGLALLLGAVTVVAPNQAPTKAQIQWRPKQDAAYVYLIRHGWWFADSPWEFVWKIAVQLDRVSNDSVSATFKRERLAYQIMPEFYSGKSIWGRQVSKPRYHELSSLSQSFQQEYSRSGITTDGKYGCYFADDAKSFIPAQDAFAGFVYPGRPVGIDDNWDHQSKITNGKGRPALQTSHFVYVGDETIEGVPCNKIQLSGSYVAHQAAIVGTYWIRQDDGSVERARLGASFPNFKNPYGPGSEVDSILKENLLFDEYFLFERIH